MEDAMVVVLESYTENRFITATVIANTQQDLNDAIKYLNEKYNTKFSSESSICVTSQYLETYKIISEREILSGNQYDDLKVR